MNRATPRSRRASPSSQLPAHAFSLPSRTDFYREEFLKHRRCLDRQREYFSEQAIDGVEHALESILARLDTLCRHQNCDEVIAELLKKFDLVTCLSAWDDYGRAQ
jgi:hypothetical protein